MPRALHLQKYWLKGNILQKISLRIPCFLSMVAVVFLTIDLVKYSFYANY